MNDAILKFRADHPNDQRSDLELLQAIGEHFERNRLSFDAFPEFKDDWAKFKRIGAPGPVEEFTRGVARGVDSLQATNYGAGALIADAAGAEGLRDKLMEGYARNMEEAAENPSSVGTFRNVYGPRDVPRYVAGLFGVAAPSVAESAIVSLGSAGAAAIPSFVSKGAIKGFIRQKLAKKLGAELTEDLIGKLGTVKRGELWNVIEGSLGQELSKKLRQEWMQTVGTRAAVAHSVFQNTGATYGDIAEQGLENTEKWDRIRSGLVGGGLSGMLDSALPAWAVRKIFPGVKPVDAKVALNRAITKAMREPGRAERFFKGLVTAGATESWTEAAQEAIQMVAANHAVYGNLEDAINAIDGDELAERMIESALAGAAGGILMGGPIAGVDAMRQPSKAKPEVAKTVNKIREELKLDKPTTPPATTESTERTTVQQPGVQPVPPPTEGAGGQVQGPLPERPAGQAESVQPKVVASENATNNQNQLSPEIQPETVVEPPPPPPIEIGQRVQWEAKRGKEIILKTGRITGLREDGRYTIQREGRGSDVALLREQISEIPEEAPREEEQPSPPAETLPASETAQIEEESQTTEEASAPNKEKPAEVKQELPEIKQEFNDGDVIEWLEPRAGGYSPVQGKVIGVEEINGNMTYKVERSSGLTKFVRFENARIPEKIIEEPEVKAEAEPEEEASETETEAEKAKRKQGPTNFNQLTGRFVVESIARAIPPVESADTFQSVDPAFTFVPAEELEPEGEELHKQLVLDARSKYIHTESGLRLDRDALLQHLLGVGASPVLAKKIVSGEKVQLNGDGIDTWLTGADGILRNQEAIKGHLAGLKSRTSEQEQLLEKLRSNEGLVEADARAIISKLSDIRADMTKAVAPAYTRNAVAIQFSEDNEFFPGQVVVAGVFHHPRANTRGAYRIHGLNSASVPIQEILDGTVKVLGMLRFPNSASRQFHMRFNTEAEFREAIPESAVRTFEQFEDDINKGTGASQQQLFEETVADTNAETPAEALERSENVSPTGTIHPLPRDVAEFFYNLIKNGADAQAILQAIRASGSRRFGEAYLNLVRSLPGEGDQRALAAAEVLINAYDPNLPSFANFYSHFDESTDKIEKEARAAREDPPDHEPVAATESKPLPRVDLETGQRVVTPELPLSKGAVERTVQAAENPKLTPAQQRTADLAMRFKLSESGRAAVHEILKVLEQSSPEHFNSLQIRHDTPAEIAEILNQSVEGYAALYSPQYNLMWINPDLQGDAAAVAVIHESGHLIVEHVLFNDALTAYLDLSAAQIQRAAKQYSGKDVDGEAVKNIIIKAAQTTVEGLSPAEQKAFRQALTYMHEWAVAQFTRVVRMGAGKTFDEGKVKTTLKKEGLAEAFIDRLITLAKLMRDVALKFIGRHTEAHPDFDAAVRELLLGNKEPIGVSVSGDAIYAAPAFHASPHTFKQFSTKYIGTGEGNQAYGWGLYFASKREVAEWYQNSFEYVARNFQKPGIKVGGVLLDGVNFGRDGLEFSADAIEELGVKIPNGVDREKFAFTVNQLLGYLFHEYRANVSKAGFEEDWLRGRKKELERFYKTEEEALAALKEELGEQLFNAAVERDRGIVYASDWMVNGTPESIALSASDLLRENYWRNRTHKTRIDSYKYKIPDQYNYEVEVIDALLEAGITRDATKNAPIYGVELAPEEDEYLLWDKPLSEQSEKVKAFLGKQFSLPSFNEDFETAGKFYRSRTRKLQNQKMASAELRALGIRGIKYLDGSSRRKGEGNYNYVIFDEADVQITHINDEPFYGMPKQEPESTLLQRAYNRTRPEQAVQFGYADLSGHERPDLILNRAASVWQTLDVIRNMLVAGYMDATSATEENAVKQTPFHYDPTEMLDYVTKRGGVVTELENIADPKDQRNVAHVASIGLSKAAASNARKITKVSEKLESDQKELIKVTKQLDKMPADTKPQKRKAKLVNTIQKATVHLKGLSRMDRIMTEQQRQLAGYFEGTIQAAAMNGTHIIVPTDESSPEAKFTKINFNFEIGNLESLSQEQRIALRRQSDWLANEENRSKDPFFYNVVEAQFRMLGTMATEKAFLSTRATPWMRPISMIFKEIGHPASQDLTRQLFMYQSIYESSQNDAVRLGRMADEARAKVMNAMGIWGKPYAIDMFKALIDNRMKNYFEQDGATFEGFKATLTKDPAIRPYINEKMLKALEAYSRIEAENSAMINGINMQFSRVHDRRIKIVNPVTGQREEIDRMALDLGTYTFMIRPNVREIGLFLDQMQGTAWDADLDAPVQMVGHLFENPQVVERFLIPLIMKDRNPIFVGADPETGDITSLSPAQIQGYWEDAQGNVHAFFELLTGGNDDALLQNLRFLKQIYSQTKRILKNSERRKDGTMAAHHMILDARERDTLPHEWLNYHSHGETANRHMLSAVAFQGAFGRDGAIFNDRIKVLSTYYDKLDRQWADIRGLSKEQQLERVKTMNADFPQDWNPARRLRELKRSGQIKGDLNHAEKSFNGIFNSPYAYNHELGFTLEALHLMSAGVLSGVRSALVQWNSVYFPLLFFGTGKTSFHMIKDSFFDTMKSMVGSFFETFGVTIGKGNHHFELLRRTRGIDPSSYTGPIRLFKQLAANMGTDGTYQNRPVMRLMRMLNMFLRSGFKAQGAEGLYAAFNPFNIFRWTILGLNDGAIVSTWKAYERLVDAATKWMYANGDQDPSFKFTAKMLGYGNHEFEALNTMLKQHVGTTLEDVAHRRAKEGAGSPHFTDQQYRQIAQIAMTYIISESNPFTARAPFMVNNPIGRVAFPLLGWATNQPNNFMQSFKTGTSDATYRSIAAGLLTFTAAVLPLSLAFSVFMDWFDEEAMGKKSGIRPLFGGGAGNMAASAVERFTRWGPAGIVAEPLNLAFNVGADGGDVRTLSLDNRVLLANSIRMTIGAVGTMMSQGSVTYASVGRPLAQAAGLNGMLQNLQFTTHAANSVLGMDIDSTEYRINRRTDVSNWLRASGKIEKLDVRTFSGGYAQPTPLTPHVTDMILSAYANDRGGFMEARRRAISAAREMGKEDPEKAVTDSFSGRHPLKSVFRSPPTPVELNNMLRHMSDDGRTSVQEAIRLHNFFGQSIGARPYFGKQEKTKGTTVRTRKRSVSANYGVGGLYY